MNSADCKSRAHRRIPFAAATLLLPLAVHGATIPVGCAADQLRTAITTANSTAGADILQLAPACTYTFTTVDNAWYGPNALPPIASDITIEGNGAILLAASAGSPMRFFYVSGGLSPAHGGSNAVPAGALTLRNLTLKSGKALGGSSDFGGGGAGMGGAIFNQGTVTLIADTLVDNHATGGSTVNVPSQYGGGGMGADAAGANGGGFGSSFGSYGGAGGAGDPMASGGGGGFSANGGTGYGTNAGGGNSDWGGLGFFGPVTYGDAGAGAGAGPGGNGGDFGFGGASGTFAGGGGGIGGGGGSAGPNGYGGGGGFGGGGGGGFFPGTGGFGGGGGNGAGGVAGGYGGGTGGGGAGMGGAIFNLNGTLTIINSTLTGNQAIGGTSNAGGNGGAGLGGAIFNLQGSVDVRFSTLAFNIATGFSSDGGALYNVGYLAGDDGGMLQTVSTVTLVNSILSNSSGAVSISDLATDAPASLPGGNANIAIATVTLDSSDIVISTSRLGNSTIVGTPITIDPNLGPLQNNGGPTMTMALSSISAAIDAGNSAGAPATDQRGCPRNVGLAPDIGAYELFDSADVVFRDGFEGIPSCL